MLERFKAFFNFKFNEKTTVVSDLLKDCQAAILVVDGFEETELVCTKAALESHSCTTSIVSLTRGQLRSSRGRKFSADLSVDEAESLIFDFLVLPNGDKRIETLRKNREALEFIRSFIWHDYPIAIGAKWETDETLAGANTTTTRNTAEMINKFNEGKIPPVNKGESNEYNWIDQHQP